MPATATPPAAGARRMEGIASFRPGTWDGVPVSKDDLAAMVRNFEALSAGDEPYYSPFVSVNHDDGLAFGRLTRAYMDGETFTLDADGIPDPVAGWVDGGNLQAPSIEFWEPGKFRMPDGSLNTTPVLKCLTLLGNKAPAVKGLGPLPPTKFADAAAVRRFACQRQTRRFGDTAMGDRNAMLEALKAMDFPVDKIPADLPDDAVKAILEFCQKANANPPPAETPAAPVAMADPAAAVTVPTVGGTTPGGQPQQITLKFSDAAAAKAFGALPAPVQQSYAAMVNEYENLRQNLAAVNRDAGSRLAQAKAAKVRAFGDRMTGKGQQSARMTPAQYAALEPLLLSADDAAVRKFADGRHEGTALDEHLARLEAQFPTVRKFGDQYSDLPGGGTVAPFAGAGGNGVDPETRRILLSQSPHGRKLLAAEAKK